MFTGCAPVETVDECISLPDPYGFWGGLWHGVITFPAFLLSLVFEGIAIYAYDNNGNWYNFGFLLGNGTMIRGIKGIIDSFFD